MVGSRGSGGRNESILKVSAYWDCRCMVYGVWGGGGDKDEMKYLMAKGILMGNKAVFCSSNS